MPKCRKKENSLAVIAVFAVVALAVCVAAVALFFRSRNKQPAPSAVPTQTVAPTEPTPPPNTGDPSAFYMEDGFLRYADGEYMVGIDVSAHQEEIDWQALRESGVEFVILRVGYRGSTEGGLYADDCFPSHYEGAKAAGLQIGAYFFSQARTALEAAEEGAFACELLRDYALDLPVFYDWETVEGSERLPSPEGVPMTQCALSFCQMVEDDGFRAGVYFNQTYGYLHLDLAALSDYTLWLAEYGDSPSFAYAFDCLQYSAEGTVAGIAEPVDLDIYILHGTEEETQ